MSEELLEDLSLIILKNHILSLSTDQLIEFYKDEEKFLCFLDTLALLSQREPAFFLLSPDIGNRINLVLDIHRFSINDEEISLYINDVLVYLNGLENIPENIVLPIISSYIKFNENIRNVQFNDINDFVYSLSYDAVFMNALIENNMSNLTSHKMNMASFNYLISTSPVFFKNEDVLRRANLVLDNEKKDARLFSKKKKNIRDLRNYLDLISKEE